MSDQPPEAPSEPVIPDLRQAALRRQSLTKSLVGGVIGFTASVSLWVLVYAMTGFNSFLFGFVVGIIVGLCVWALGRGCTPAFGLIGAAFAIGATLTSYVLVVQIIEANSLQTPIFQHLFSQQPGAWFDLYFKQYFVPFHLFAYIIAGLEGFSLAFRRV